MSQTMASDPSGTIATTASVSRPDRPAGAIVEPEAWHAPEWPADEERATLESRLQAQSDHPDQPRPELQPATSRVRRHRDVLAVSIAVLILSFALVEVLGGRIAIRGLSRYPLPPSCVSWSLLGVRCPGCGLTRSFLHLAEGDWRGSWQCHRLGWLLAAVLIVQIPYRLLALRRPESPPIPPRWQARMGFVLIALLIVNWLADVVTGRLASL
jgi:hypothetical protein